MASSMNLNLGSGSARIPGYMNVDRVEHSAVDYVVDLEKEHLPLRDESVGCILASHILEHLANWEEVMVECHRVLMPHGLMSVWVPYGVTYVAGHKRFFNDSSMDLFCKDTEFHSLDKKLLFKVMAMKVNRQTPWWLVHYLHFPKWLLPIKPYEVYWLLEKVKT